MVVVLVLCHPDDARLLLDMERSEEMLLYRCAVGGEKHTLA